MPDFSSPLPGHLLKYYGPKPTLLLIFSLLLPHPPKNIICRRAPSCQPDSGSIENPEKLLTCTRFFSTLLYNNMTPLTHVPTLAPFPTIGYQEQYQVRTYEIDSQKRATIPALVRLMHEAAMQNVMELKLSYWDLDSIKLSWILLRKHLFVNRLPRLGENIFIQTYPAGFDRFFTYRDYRILNENHELLVGSSSSWLLMHTEHRKMAPLPDFIRAFHAQMPPIEQCLPRPKTNLQQPERTDFERTFRVGWHDLDFNQHLNNTYYVQWMLETLPARVLESGQLHTLDINYRSECRYEEMALAETERVGPGHYRHQLLNAETNKLLAVCTTSWG